MQNFYLSMKGISKYFTGMKALDEVDFNLKEGEIHALLGINGAGKSTLIKVLSGIYPKDGGEIFINGEKVTINNAKDAIKLGVSTVYQDPQMIESFKGYENIYLGSENEKKSTLSWISHKKMREQALKLLEEYPLEIDIDKPVYSLSAIEREILAVLRALSKDCKILILDEPTSILTEKEKYILFDFMRLLKSKGVAIIYVTHHLDEVEKICDAFTVFRGGKHIAFERVENGQVDANHIAELMLGEKIDNLYPEKTSESTGEKVMQCVDINLEGKLSNITFDVQKGEILGVFGLVGSGIDELSKIMFGAMYKTSGEIKLNGETVELKETGHAIKNGIFLVPGSRKTEGQIGNYEIYKNLSISKLEKLTNKLQLVNTKKEQVDSQELIDKLSIATTSSAKKVQELSGGNQQKVVIGKGLYTDANIYIFCEPTVGVDVGAKSAIYEIMRELSKKAAVVIISSDPEEVLGNADRVLVMNHGEIRMNELSNDTSLQTMLVKATSNM